jgi:hypothetical protein
LQWLDADGLAHRLRTGDAQTVFRAPLGPYQEGTAIIPAQLEHWHDIVALTTRHGIKLTVFGSPVYWRVLTTQDLQLRRKLFLAIFNSVGHGFVDFGNVNQVTANHDNFVDMEHYNEDTARLVVKKLYCPSCDEGGSDFGTYVDPSNVDDYLRALRNALEHYSEPGLASG